MSEPKIIETFGRAPSAYECPLCRIDRHYYDRLDDGTDICLDCSDKHGYEPADGAVIHPRDPVLLAKDPEIVEIKNKVLKRRLEHEDFATFGLKIPKTMGEALARRVETEGSSLQLVILSALEVYLNLVPEIKVEDSEEDAEVVAWPA